VFDRPPLGKHNAVFNPAAALSSQNGQIGMAQETTTRGRPIRPTQRAGSNQATERQPSEKLMLEQLENRGAFWGDSLRKPLKSLARETGLEPATSGVTGRTKFSEINDRS
jgi:hypothetical protein